MAKAKKKSPPELRQGPAALAAEALADAGEQKTEKVENWASDASLHTEFFEIYTQVQKAFENKQEQSDGVEEYWSIYNAELDDNQVYLGNSQAYVPTARDCIKARVKRCIKQQFPANHRHVTAISETGRKPFATLSLLESYIRRSGIKNVARMDQTAGDVTGHWTLYVDWAKRRREIHQIVRRSPVIESIDGEEFDSLDDEDQDEDLEDKEIVDERPVVTAIPMDDLAVVPPTVEDIEDADWTAVKLRLSKDRMKQYIEDGVFEGEIDEIWKQAQPDGNSDRKVPAKKRTSDAGVKTEGTWKYCLIYECHGMIKLPDDERKTPVYLYFAGPNLCIGAIRNPLWSGRRPVISAPVDPVAGSFWGRSPLEAVKFLQWSLNDFWNLGQDSGMYSVLPITMTDPTKNPNYAAMVMGLAAVWPVDPKSTAFATFPAVYKDAHTICEAIKRQIMESLDTNDAMLGKMPPGRKNNAMVGAMQSEQETAIVDQAARYEEVILTKLLERMYELDRQFRTEDVLVTKLGETGAMVSVERIEPQQFEEAYFFQWVGTDFQKSIARIQQMIAAMNVLRGIPPQQLGGRRLDVGPILEYMVETVFGAEMAPKILIDERNQYTIPADTENHMMHNGMSVPTNPGDNDQEHLQAHNQAAVSTGDPKGIIRTHMQEHVAKLQAKMQAMMGAQQKPGGVQGAPGSGPPGIPGTPKPGAQPQQPRPQGPPGMIQQDSMPGMPGRG